MERCVLFHPWTVAAVIMSWDQSVVRVACIKGLHDFIVIAGIRRILGMNRSKQTADDKKKLGGDKNRLVSCITRSMHTIHPV